MKPRLPRNSPANTPKRQRLLLQLSAWRKHRRHRQPIPEPLWQAAAVLARTHGVSPISSALRLNYYDLQRRASAFAGSAKPSAPPTFLEVPVATWQPPVGDLATVELAHPSGSRLTLRLQNSSDLLAVVQTFLRS